MSMKTAVVTTTINIPKFLESYADDCNSNFNPISTVFIIVGDLKTPESRVQKYLKNLKTDLNIEFWTIDEQRKWLSDNNMNHIAFDVIIPENSIQRRNFGYLRALELDSDITITVDDDNYATPKWFYHHYQMFSEKNARVVSSSNSVVNPCAVLDLNHSLVYSRGYPLSKWCKDTFDLGDENKRKIVLNQGLWINSPDVDAVTHLYNENLLSQGFDKIWQEQNYAMAQDNYFPINTQNTAFKTKLTSVFCDLPMDRTIPIDRYDDIWAGWIIQKLAHQCGETVTFGLPLSSHIRNKHDYVKDFKSEFLGMILNERFFTAIKNLQLTTCDYNFGYQEIAEYLSTTDYISNDNRINKYLRKMSQAMVFWNEICDKI